MSQNLDLRQSQNLVMTPQMQQAIKLLQLNNMELGELVEAELENNPLLEKDERGSEDNSEAQNTENATSDQDGDNINEAFDPQTPAMISTRKAR